MTFFVYNLKSVIKKTAVQTIMLYTKTVSFFQKECSKNKISYLFSIDAVRNWQSFVLIFRLINFFFIWKRFECTLEVRRTSSTHARRFQAIFDKFRQDFSKFSMDRRATNSRQNMTKINQPCHRNHVSVITFTYMYILHTVYM